MRSSIRFLVPRLFTVFALAATAPNVSAKGTKEWTTLSNCQLIANKANDGDSFHFRAHRTEYVGRLYFVDAPETGGLNAAQLIAQAEYFGIEVPQVVEIAKKAKLFTNSKLAEPFTFQTRGATAGGHSKIQRVYGLVQTKDGDLGELLVANGLARIHGTKVVRPGASKAAEEIERLKGLEEQAKKAKKGGWGINAGSSQAAGGSPPPVNPGQLESSTGQTPAPQTAFSNTILKLDVNKATKEELQEIPGIGETLADRIIAARPFSSADDLRRVKGIGDGKTYERIRAYFR